MDESYRQGFTDALDCVLQIARLNGGDIFAEVSELATKLRLQKAGAIMKDLQGGE